MSVVPAGWVRSPGGRLCSWGGPEAPVHGFTTRSGGVSEPPFDSLNVSTRHGDAAEHVAENLRRIRKDLCLSEPWLTVDQVHGTAVCIVDDSATIPAGTRADALITATPGIAIAVGVADCTPLLAWGPHPTDGRPAGLVLAIHAGWRGTAAGVVQATIDRAEQVFGIRPGSLTVAIGASARSCCYEVGDEVVEALDQALRNTGGTKPEDSTGSAPWLDRTHGRARVSPAVVARAQLRAAGVPPGQIHDLGQCTLCGADTWFSYRRDGIRSGRALAIIRSAPSA